MLAGEPCPRCQRSGVGDRGRIPACCLLGPLLPEGAELGPARWRPHRRGFVPRPGAVLGSSTLGSRPWQLLCWDTAASSRPQQARRVGVRAATGWTSSGAATCAVAA